MSPNILNKHPAQLLANFANCPDYQAMWTIPYAMQLTGIVITSWSNLKIIIRFIKFVFCHSGLSVALSNFGRRVVLLHIQTTYCDDWFFFRFCLKHLQCWRGWNTEVLLDARRTVEMVLELWQEFHMPSMSEF